MAKSLCSQSSVWSMGRGPALTCCNYAWHSKDQRSCVLHLKPYTDNEKHWKEKDSIKKKKSKTTNHSHKYSCKIFQICISKSNSTIYKTITYHNIQGDAGLFQLWKLSAMHYITDQRRKSPDSTKQSWTSITGKIQDVLWIKPVIKLGRVSDSQITLTKKKKKTHLIFY